MSTNYTIPDEISIYEGTSHVIPDRLLTRWLFEAINYESFIYTLSRYEQEVLYYKALDYEQRLFRETEADITNEVGDMENWKKYGLVLDKLRAETYYENSQNLRKVLKPLIKPIQPTPIGESANSLGVGDNSVRINPESIDDVYSILKGYFEEADHIRLSNRLKGFEDGQSKLLFLEDGNKLADACKQIYEGRMLQYANKLQLEEWIARNFQYKAPADTGSAKDFSAKYLNSIISSNTKICKDPILKIDLVAGRPSIVPTVRIKKKY